MKCGELRGQDKFEDCQYIRLMEGRNGLQMKKNK